jgi:hypothetical protein
LIRGRAEAEPDNGVVRTLRVAQLRQDRRIGRAARDGYLTEPDLSGGAREYEVLGRVPVQGLVDDRVTVPSS